MHRVPAIGDVIKPGLLDATPRVTDSSGKGRFIDTPNTQSAPSDLESVIVTNELDRRVSRPPNPDAERKALLDLTRDLSRWPKEFFGKLASYVLKLSQAQSAGVSLLNEAERRFVWPAVAGDLASLVGAGTPSDFGPCGTVLDRQKTLLFRRPERHFTYLASISPPLEEVLLVPFYIDGKAVGTVWAVSHLPEVEFDHEDRRILESLSTFATSAYGVLAKTGGLEPLLQMRLGADPTSTDPGLN